MSTRLTSDQIREMSLQASHEVDSIGAILLKLAPECANGSLLDEGAMRGFGLRLRTLADVLMTTAAGDADADTWHDFYGEQL